MSQQALFEAKAAPRLPSLRHLGAQLIRLRHVWILLVIAIFLTLGLATNISHVTAKGLFQSPQSPPAQPEAPVPQPAPPVEATPTEQPPPTQAPVEQAPVEQAPAVEEQPAQPEQAAPEQPPLPESTSPPAPAAGDTRHLSPTAAAPAGRDRPARDTAGEDIPDEETGNSPRNFILDRVEFIDSVIVSGAYVWLCCGVALFLVVPVFMLVLYIRGRSKIVAEDEF
ncbi:MAG: hypothetical protein AB1801_06900 [Chloroflexota bacterium]